MHEAKQKSVEGLPAAERFGYFVRKVADYEELWGLFDDGWALAAGSDGKKVMPFWPEREFAAACASGNWEKHCPRLVSLDDFLQKWVPGLTHDGVEVAVFPTTNEKGVIVSAAALAEAIDRERAQYE